MASMLHGLDIHCFFPWFGVLVKRCKGHTPVAIMSNEVLMTRVCGFSFSDEQVI